MIKRYDAAGGSDISEDRDGEFVLYDDLCDKVKALIQTVHHNACVNTIRESASHWGIVDDATRPPHPPIDTIMKDGGAGIEKDFTKP